MKTLKGLPPQYYHKIQKDEIKEINNKLKALEKALSQVRKEIKRVLKQ